MNELKEIMIKIQCIEILGKEVPSPMYTALESAYHGHFGEWSTDTIKMYDSKKGN